jgi:dTDP-4-amino-4,6-dideoxygalactose transaminase
MTEKKIRGMDVVITDVEREQIMARMNRVLSRGWFIWGDEQEEFQKQFATLTGREHAVTLNSATAGLECLFRILADRGRQIVCFQANNFPSPVMAALRAGLEVTWADIDPQALCPSEVELEQAYAEIRFDVLVLTWTGGFVSADVEAIRRWAKDRAVYLIEDASHAAGSFSGGRPAGSFGDTAVFSLAATKALHTGQGGMLLTDDAEIRDRVFRMKNYGRTELFQRGQYVEPSGFNAQMTELQAAVGNVLIQTMPLRVAERTRWAERYAPLLPELGHRKGCAPNFYKYPALVPRAEDQAALKEFLAGRQIELGSAIYEFVTPALDVWAQAPHPTGPWAPGDFPQALEYSRRHVALPMHNGLSQEDVERVGEAVTAYFRQTRQAP